MIELFDGYMIGSDAYQYILGRPTDQIDKRTGKPYNSFLDSTYHKTVSSALLSFYKMKARELVAEDKQTLDEYIDLSKKIEERILDLKIEPTVDTFKR